MTQYNQAPVLADVWGNGGTALRSTKLPLHSGCLLTAWVLRLVWMWPKRKIIRRNVNTGRPARSQSLYWLSYSGTEVPNTEQPELKSNHDKLHPEYSASLVISDLRMSRLKPWRAIDYAVPIVSHQSSKQAARHSLLSHEHEVRRHDVLTLFTSGGTNSQAEADRTL